MTSSLIAAMLERHEGRRQFVYMDTKGIPTIACGRNLRDRGLLPQEIDFLRDNDIMDATSDLETLFMIGGAWNNAWNNMGQVRRDALTDMRFQLGAGGFREFHKMIAHVIAGDFDAAATEALDSAWAREVPDRAKEVTDMLRSGEPPAWWSGGA